MFALILIYLPCFWSGPLPQPELGATRAPGMWESLSAPQAVSVAAESAPSEESRPRLQGGGPLPEVGLDPAVRESATAAIDRGCLPSGPLPGDRISHSQVGAARSPAEPGSPHALQAAAGAWFPAHAEIFALWAADRDLGR